ncbi:MAG: hypothetical protein OIF54_05325, partial [Cohaesibacter sp.]|nr:hypothetical protein [Cohaesibacter sp.]
HKETFLLASLSVVGIARPFFVPSISFATAGLGFIFAFSDILYVGETIMIVLVCASQMIAGMQVAQLRLHGSDLRGSTIGHTVWGRYSTLQNIRGKIAVCLDEIRNKSGVRS